MHVHVCTCIQSYTLKIFTHTYVHYMLPIILSHHHTSCHSLTAYKTPKQHDLDVFTNHHFNLIVKRPRKHWQHFYYHRYRGVTVYQSSGGYCCTTLSDSDPELVNIFNHTLYCHSTVAILSDSCHVGIHIAGDCRIEIYNNWSVCTCI